MKAIAGIIGAVSFIVWSMIASTLVLFLLVVFGIFVHAIVVTIF